MINIIQINVDGGKSAQDLLMATANDRGADILIVSNPIDADQKRKGGFPTVLTERLWL